jgi:Sigma-70, region 4
MGRLACGHAVDTVYLRLRPCPFVSCSHHLFLDANEETGALKFNFPHLEPWELRETCALDVAEKGGTTLEEVAQLANLTRERIRQIEFRSIAKLRLRAPELAEPATGTASAASQNGDTW